MVRRVAAVAAENAASHARFQKPYTDHYAGVRRSRAEVRPRKNAVGFLHSVKRVLVFSGYTGYRPEKQTHPVHIEQDML